MTTTDRAAGAGGAEQRDSWTVRVVFGAGKWLVGLGALATVAWIVGLGMVGATGNGPQTDIGAALFFGGLFACLCTSLATGFRLNGAGEGWFTCLAGGVYVGFLALLHVVLWLVNLVLTPFSLFR